MKRPVVAVDIDEVLFPFTHEILGYYNRIDGTNFRYEDVRSFDLETIWGGTRQEAVDRVHVFQRVEQRSMMPIMHSQEITRRLSKLHDLVVVTSRDDRFTEPTVRWINHHFPETFRDIILAGNHYTGLPYRTKLEVCREVGANILIEDQLKYAIECVGGGVQVLLFGDYGWNHAPDLPKGITRVRSWLEAEEALRLAVA